MPLATLSGGFKLRVLLAQVLLGGPDVLVPDEPTNHLDLESIDALVAALKAFEEGTLVFVSHDRAFVSALATRILEVTPQGFRDFPGSYDEYLERCGDDHLDADAVVRKAKKEKVVQTGDKAQPAKSEIALSSDEQKKRNNRLKQLPIKRDEVVSAIEVAEARKAFIQAKWCEPGFYEKTPKAEVVNLEDEEKALGPKIDALLAGWESLEAELAEASGPR